MDLQAELLIFLLTFFNEEAFSQICEFSPFRRSRVIRPHLSVGPITRVTTVDKESAVTFSCEASLSILDGPSFCLGLSNDRDRPFESQEDLIMQLAMAVEWKIDQMGPFNSTESLTPALTERGLSISTNCLFDADQLFDFSQDRSLCSDRPTSDIIPRCSSFINITRVESNSNVRLQCSVRLLQCSENSRFMDTSSIVYLRLQGLLGPPPGLRIDNLNSTTLFLSWNPPNTLSEIPISHYSVDINNFITISTINVTAADQPSLDPNMTSLDLSRVGSTGYLYNPSCESLQFRVRAWNSVGEGASSSVLYSQESLQNTKIYTTLHSPDIVCVLCEFAPASEALGCQAILLEEKKNSHTTNLSKITIDFHTSRTGGNEAFDCFSDVPAGNFTVTIREIECTGGIGAREFVHKHVSVTGVDEFPTEGIECDGAQATLNDAQTIGLSVTTVVLVVGMLLLVVLVFGLVMVILRVKKAKHSGETILKGNQLQSDTLLSQQASAKPTADPQESPKLSQEKDLLCNNYYENHHSVSTTKDPHVLDLPSTEHTYTAVARSGQLCTKVDPNTNSRDIELQSCVAYGFPA